MLEKEFVPYQESLVLKELGFDEPCISGYSTTTKQRYFYLRPTSTQDSFTVDNPTYSQAFRFFRKKYGLYQIIIQNTDNDWTYDVITIKGIDDFEILDVLNSYEEAELACLKELIEIVKKINNE